MESFTKELGLNELLEPLPILPSEPMTRARIGSFNYCYKIHQNCLLKFLEFIELPNITQAQKDCAIQSFAKVKNACKNHFSINQQLHRLERVINAPKGSDTSKIQDEIILAYSYEPNKPLPKWSYRDFDDLHTELTRDNYLNGLKKVSDEFESLISRLANQTEP